MGKQNNLFRMFRLVIILFVTLYAANAEDLKKCYCTTCAANTTIGRVVDDKCYFIPLNVVYKADNETISYENRYPAFIQNSSIEHSMNTTSAESLVSSLSSELFLRFKLRQMILWFKDSSFYSTATLPCPLLNIPLDVKFSDCQFQANVIFVAENGNYTIVEGNTTKSKPFELKPCGSKTYAVHNEKRCFYLATNGECNKNDRLFVVNTTFAYQSIGEFVNQKLYDENLTEMNFMLESGTMNLNNDPQQFFLFIESDLDVQPRCYTADFHTRKIRRRNSDLSCEMNRESLPILCQTGVSGLLDWLFQDRYTLFYYGIGVIGVLIAATIGVLCIVYFQRRKTNKLFDI